VETNETEHQQNGENSSKTFPCLLDFETLQKQKFSPIVKQTAAARNDVTAKKIASGLFQNL